MGKYYYPGMDQIFWCPDKSWGQRTWSIFQFTTKDLFLKIINSTSKLKDSQENI